MNTNRRRRLGVAGLGIVIALLVAMPSAHSLPQTETKKKVQVAIGLDTNSTTEERISREVKLQLRSRGVQFREQEVRTASRDALDLVSKSKDPLKGVIYIKTKKFTICISWGSDKNFCKSH
jgi:hypothetical protein